jgi:hypothetical protein
MVGVRNLRSGHEGSINTTLMTKRKRQRKRKRTERAIRKNATAGVNRFSAGLILALPRLRIQLWIVVRFASQPKPQWWPDGQVAWLSSNEVEPLAGS